MRSLGGESQWVRPRQVELLNRRRWRTRIELANATFESLEILHNYPRRQRPRDTDPSPRTTNSGQAWFSAVFLSCAGYL